MSYSQRMNRQRAREAHRAAEAALEARTVHWVEPDGRHVHFVDWKPETIAAHKEEVRKGFKCQDDALSVQTSTPAINIHSKPKKPSFVGTIKLLLGLERKRK